MSTIALDIEVAGLPWDEVDEVTRGYLLNRARTPEDREAVPDRTGLTTGLGKVIAVGLWLVEEDRGFLLLEGKSTPKHEWEKVKNSQIMRGTEKELLTELWTLIGPREKKPAPRIVTYNGRSYDGPWLTIRSAQLGVRPSVNLSGYRYSVDPHCDLQEVFSFQGATRDTYSLDYWCRRFDIESSKGKLDGSQVARAYRDGRIEDIGEYCLRDVRATAQLYTKIETTLLPLFRGGGR